MGRCVLHVARQSRILFCLQSISCCFSLNKMLLAVNITDGLHLWLCVSTVIGASVWYAYEYQIVRQDRQHATCMMRLRITVILKSRVSSWQVCIHFRHGTAVQDELLWRPVLTRYVLHGFFMCSCQYTPLCQGPCHNHLPSRKYSGLQPWHCGIGELYCHTVSLRLFAEF